MLNRRMVDVIYAKLSFSLSQLMQYMTQGRKIIISLVIVQMTKFPSHLQTNKKMSFEPKFHHAFWRLFWGFIEIFTFIPTKDDFGKQA